MFISFGFLPPRGLLAQVNLKLQSLGRRFKSHDVTYVFEHIPKTAGTTFNFSYLPAAFAGSEVVIIPGGPDERQREIERLKSLSGTRLKRYKIISGHHAEKLRPHLLQVRWLTLVRDPVERAISSYLHAIHHPGARDTLGKEIQASGLTLVQYVEREWLLPRSNDLGGLRDLQARVLLGTDHANIVADRELVRDRIRQRYHLVGCTEAFESFLFLLHIRDGFPLVLFKNRMVRRERERFQVTAEELAVLARLTASDRVVYDVTREEFDRDFSEALTPELRGLFERYCAALRTFQTGDPDGAESRAAIYREV
jgi:hypothetical protein